MREIIKSLTPRPLLNAARDTRDWLQRAVEWPAATFHPDRRESIRRLAEMKDAHQGKRCFIIGNGPSLKDTDMQQLRGEYTFGMNRVTLAFPEWGFTTSYLVSVNSLVIQQCAEDFLAQPMPVFLSWRTRGAVHRDQFTVHSSQSPVHKTNSTTEEVLFPPSHLASLADAQGKPRAPHPAARTSHPIYLHTTYTGPRFAEDARGRLWEGATVTYVCLQLAFHMGFETAVLIGVDHSFVSQGKPNTTVVSKGDDPNHFSAGYFGKGFRWQLPDLDTSEIGYWMAKKAYEDAGRQVLDATVGGKLQVFKKVEFMNLFTEKPGQ